MSKDIAYMVSRIANDQNPESPDYASIILAVAGGRAPADVEWFERLAARLTTAPTLVEELIAEIDG